MKKLLLIGIALLVIGSAGYGVGHYLRKDHHGLKIDDPYYEKLAQECQKRTSPNCCLASLEAMIGDNAREIPESGVCDYGYKREMMSCIDSFVWCKPITINETSKEAFYQNLRDNCELKFNGEQKDCCLDSVKAMEVVGATTLFPGGKYEEDEKYDCGEGLEPMALRCPGSYTWCQTLNNPEGEDFIPVPIKAPRIEVERPEVSDSKPKDEKNSPICTMEVKQCPDGTYVGRTGPKCEFSPCPGDK